MWKIIKELIAAILCRCPKCWQPLACQRHWIGNVEGYGNYYCPECDNMKGEEYEDVHTRRADRQADRAGVCRTENKITI